MVDTWTPVLKVYQEKVVSIVTKGCDSLGPPGRLREACEYALLQSGSNRVRSSFVLMISDALNLGGDPSWAAWAVECFVVAAKAVDDFPSMDNTDRRGPVEALHRRHGEGVALLASYALIAAGFQGFARAASDLASANLPHSHEYGIRLQRVIEMGGHSIGTAGAAYGQWMDLTTPPGGSVEEILRIIDAKTGSLYELAAIAGWLFGGGALAEESAVRSMGRHLGRAMQMQDDWVDREVDERLKRPANLTNTVGTAEAARHLLQEVRDFEESLTTLKLPNSSLIELVRPIVAFVKAHGAHAISQC